MDDGGCPKYIGVTGNPTRLFNTRAVKRAGDTIVITEGEVDAITLNQIGIASVAVAGSQNWKPHYRRIFTGFPKVVIVGDNDKAGRKFVKEVAKGLYSARVAIIEGEEKEDCNSFFLKFGAEALREALGLAKEN
jgi:DNA primase